MQIFVNCKQVGSRRPVFAPAPRTVSDDTATLRTLLTELVRQEVAAYNARGEDTALIALLTPQQLDEHAAVGKVGFGRVYGGRKANTEAAVANALECFADGLVRVFQGDTECTDLDVPLSIAENDVFTFIRLTFLAGRMW